MPLDKTISEVTYVVHRVARQAVLPVPRTQEAAHHREGNLHLEEVLPGIHQAARGHQRQQQDRPSRRAYLSQPAC